jgi:hypothetical protein
MRKRKKKKEEDLKKQNKNAVMYNVQVMAMHAAATAN